ncbi:hypothetical protein MCUN1_003531 [Malassezia cuniculi]|uniref:Fe2OG dioxygenase domain-containing protein n=1 Tax=Malassezia cuniculi TaxID=948313 RepID=A0AAF0J8B3_9BASI|nr:hypothetical protein MCUN1_003531 [Malassezia cuniculi]
MPHHNRVPTLDIRRFDTDRDAFVAELGDAYRAFGFCCISGHGIAQEVIDDAYDSFKQFFALPESIKRAYNIPGAGGARGYTPFMVETARGAHHADLKEFWHIGREGSRAAYEAEMPENVWPKEVPSFKENGYKLYSALDALGVRVLAALALYLGLAETFFDSLVDNGNSILRAIHYPPIADTSVPNERAGAHEDINLITLLVGASAEGLEVLSGGEWIPVTPEQDAIVVNIGDMLQRLTNNFYPSTTHRVVNPAGELARVPRYSIPFFLHPNPDASVDPLPCCISPDNPSRYPESLTAHEYLLQRLRDIGLLS